MKKNPCNFSVVRVPPKVEEAKYFIGYPTHPTGNKNVTTTFSLLWIF